MLHHHRNPPASLQAAISCFWYMEHDFGTAATSFQVMPDGYAEIIFCFGADCAIERDGVLQPLPSPFLAGLLDKPLHYHTSGRLRILGIRCFPWTVFELLGLPSGTRGVQTFKHPVAGLQPVLDGCLREGGIDAAFDILAAYFLQTHAERPLDSILLKAGTAMQEAAGAIPVREVAAAAHATVRTLERKFKQSSGHTVKDVTGLMRFEQVRNRLWEQPDSNLAALAQEIGYADQAHLSKEFKRYSGATPASFARQTKARKLALGGDFVAFIQS